LKVAQIIAPSWSIESLRSEVREEALCYLKDKGYEAKFPTFSEWYISRPYIAANDCKVRQIEEAYTQDKSNILICARGGKNGQAFLNDLNYNLLSSHLKKLFGFSENTALLNAIKTKTGQVTFYGPNFEDFGQTQGKDNFREYMFQAFNHFTSDTPTTLEYIPSDSALPCEVNEIEKSSPTILKHGVEYGELIGGCLPVLLEMQPDYLPSFEGKIVFFEDVFNRAEGHHILLIKRLQQFLTYNNLDKAKALLIGRPCVPPDLLSNSEYEDALKNFFENCIPGPIICNLDFGHTIPRITIPIGGKVRIETKPCLRLEFEV
jgi:muramoyltetrapeptide carboxypeptidase